MIPRYGEPPRPHQRYGLRPGVYAILPRGGDLLVTWQGGPHQEVQLPGGGIDPGESPAQALHREVMEETGWIIGGLRRVGAHRRFTYMPDYDRWAEKICTIYMARPVRQLRAPSEPDHEPLWMPVDVALRTLATEGDAKVLRRVMGA